MNLIPCERRGGGAGGSPYRYTNFSTRTAVVDTLGNAVATVFPLATQVAVIDLEANAGVFSLSLTSSIINTVLNDTVGVFVGLDVGQTINLTGGFDIFLSHLARQNSVAGLPASSSRTNTLSFGQDSAYRLSSGAKLAIYACSANSADNEISALLSVYWSPNVG